MQPPTMCRTTISLLFLSLFVLFASTLKFNYPELDIQENSTSVGWTFDAGRNCGTVFKLQGFTLSSLSSNLIVPRITSTFNHSRNIQIPFRALSGPPIAYRLVAVDNDGTICSDQTTFYRFDVSEKTETRILSPNSTTCYDIPVTDICVSSLGFVWPQSVDSDSCSSCFCPIHNSTGGRRAFMKCACLQDADLTPYFSENGSICVSDLNSRLNGVVINFVCSNPCTGECSFLKTIISSYRIDVHEMESTTRTSHTDIGPTSTSTLQTAQSTVEMTLETVMTDDGPDTKDVTLIAAAVVCAGASLVAVIFTIATIAWFSRKNNCCGCCDDRKKSTNHHQQETDPPPSHPQALSNASQLLASTVFSRSIPCHYDMERSLVIGLRSARLRRSLTQLSDEDILDRFTEEVGRRGRGLQRALSEEEEDVGAQEMKAIAESVKHFTCNGDTTSIHFCDGEAASIPSCEATSV